MNAKCVAVDTIAERRAETDSFMEPACITSALLELYQAVLIIVRCKVLVGEVKAQAHHCTDK